MKIALITVPYDSGIYNRRLGSGPPELSPVIENEFLASAHHVRKREVLCAAHFPTEIATSFALSRMVAAEVMNAKAHHEFPVVVSGNCNTAAIGVLSGLQHRHGIVWFDCHGDLNTPETTHSGFLDGMALSIITGKCWRLLANSIPGFSPTDESKIILVGARDFDPFEEDQLMNSKISLISAGEINRRVNLIDKVFPMESIYLHIDLDVLDPAETSTNAFATPGGVSPAALLDVLKIIKSRHKIVALSFTAYDPAVDPQRSVHPVVRSIIRTLF
jgi:arginase